MTSLALRYLEKVDFSAPAGCWLWRGARIGGGYGYIRIDGRMAYAHRVLYEAYHGDFPAGLEADHLCRRRACVRPDHIEPVTRRENILRGTAPSAVNARKTHCEQGHELAGENLRLEPAGVGIGRRCRTCRRESNRRYQARYRARKRQEEADAA